MFFPDLQVSFQNKHDMLALQTGNVLPLALHCVTATYIPEAVRTTGTTSGSHGRFNENNILQNKYKEI